MTIVALFFLSNKTTQIPMDWVFKELLMLSKSYVERKVL